MSIIDKLNNMTNNKYNSDTSYNLTKTEINNFKKEFKILKNYKYIKPIELEIGMMVRYIDRENQTKVSIIGIVKNIVYYSQLNKNNVKTIFLFDIFTKNKTKWKVCPKHIYLFQVKRNYKSKIMKTLEKLIGGSIDNVCDDEFGEIDKNFDLSFFEEELNKYKNSIT
jgi:hypothetical protein